MELYFSPMACSLATRIALYEAGAEAKFTAVDLKPNRTAHAPDFFSTNPIGQVPVPRAPPLLTAHGQATERRQSVRGGDGALSGRAGAGGCGGVSGAR